MKEDYFPKRNKFVIGQFGENGKPRTIEVEDGETPKANTTSDK